MSKSKTKKQTPESLNKEIIISALIEALDRLEGQYSNIPLCCIEQFTAGRTYINFKETLKPKDQKKLDKWNYVPCDECFKDNKINKLKLNGTSIHGRVLMAIIDSLIEDK